MANISLSNIFFSYNNSDMLFTDLSCSVTNGAHVAIIGDNGTGKTTLLKIIAGFIVPDTGHVTINGECKYLGQFNTNKLKSGGQSQMDAIAAAFDSNADILLLDEPTNNLDTNARHEFYKKLRNYYGTVVIVSHDRELLNMMDTLMELRNGQIRLFGGNYDFYIKMKQSERNAIESKYVNTQKKITHLTTTKTLAQSMRHKHETKQAKDRANSANGSPIEANNLRGKSQETEAKRRKIIEKKLQTEISTLHDLSSDIRDDIIKIPLFPKNSNTKDIVLIDDMSFEYDAKTPIFKHFNLHIRGGDKLHLIGANGSGKTTLIKLICGKLSPTSGSIRTIGHIAYLDQSLSILSPNKTIVENIASIANIQIHDAHAVAANFGFRGAQSKKLVKNISGGELLKATLAAVIGSKNQPDLLILDEPANNLDIKSTTVLENALREYGGALLLVSHDNIFIKNIGIENKVLI